MYSMIRNLINYLNSADDNGLGEDVLEYSEEPEMITPTSDNSGVKTGEICTEKEREVKVENDQQEAHQNSPVENDEENSDSSSDEEESPDDVGPINDEFARYWLYDRMNFAEPLSKIYVISMNENPVLYVKTKEKASEFCQKIASDYINENFCEGKQFFISKISDHRYEVCSTSRYLLVNYECLELAITINEVSFFEKTEEDPEEDNEVSEDQEKQENTNEAKQD